MVPACWIFREPPCCFPQWLHPFTPHQECRKIPFVSDLCSMYSLWLFLMMAILTMVRWFLSVVLICIDLIIRHVECVFMCFLILYSVSIVYLLKLASWTSTLFWILFLVLYPKDVSWGRLSFPALHALWILRSLAPVLKLLFWKMATRRQHFFLPNSGYSGNQGRGGAGRGKPCSWIVDFSGKRPK